MNKDIKQKIYAEYQHDRERLRLAYKRVFRGHPDAKLVLMDMLSVHEFFEMSTHAGHRSPEYSCGFGDGKKAVLGRIFEFSGLEDEFLRCIDPTWEGTE